MKLLQALLHPSLKTAGDIKNVAWRHFAAISASCLLTLSGGRFSPLVILYFALLAFGVYRMSRVASIFILAQTALFAFASLIMFVLFIVNTVSSSGDPFYLAAGTILFVASWIVFGLVIQANNAVFAYHALPKGKR